jgi:hypothetical protein
MRIPVLLALLAGLWATSPSDARAETFNTCKGFIDTLPATISTQGTWCLGKDVSTAITTGAAIEITTNNVTIDCNNFKIGGLAAGDASLAAGIHSLNKLNVTIRNCTIRGFHKGALLDGAYNTSGGHLVEGNRFDQNLQAALEVHGDGSTVRGNYIYDTGGAVGQTVAHGLITHNDVDVIDNTIADVNSLVDPIGMAVVSNFGGVVSGNRIRGLWTVNGYYNRIGIFANNNTNVVIQDNFIINTGGTTVQATGVYCMAGSGTGTRIRNNRVLNFGVVHKDCIDDGGN